VGRDPGALAARSNQRPRRTAGARVERDWQEILPHDLLPGVMNPAAGFLYSGNHRPLNRGIRSRWEPRPAPAATPSVRGVCASGCRLSNDSRRRTLRAIHFDAVNPARRDIVRLGLHLRDRLQRELSAERTGGVRASRAVVSRGRFRRVVRAWRGAGGELNTFFRFMVTDLALVYSGGESGWPIF